ncbi:MAG: gephyrin-like molybdotransferase Glp [Solirubrobacterales bacterium]
MSELLAPSRALELVLDAAHRLDGERVPLEQALDRTLAGAIHSKRDVPGFDNSAMDGFALRAADTAAADRSRPVELEIVDESRAGSPAAREVGPGQAIRISTGAMVPAAADAVVRVEDTSSQNGLVSVRARIEPGRDIRRAGEDVRAGELVLADGALLGPAELGVAASVGAAELDCTRRPRLACLVTGDELAPPGDPLGPGQIGNTNAICLPAQGRRAGAELTLVETVGDDREATVEAIGRALDSDVVAITGGVSVGPHDHVKPALAELGVKERFWGVALRPGKPTWFGVADSGALVFGLPGNPVSAMVTFHLFVEPALARLCGCDQRGARVVAAIDVDYRKAPGRMHVVRCRLQSKEDGFHVRPTKAQGSHVLTSMLGADAFAYLEIERGDVSAGEYVEIELVDYP